MELILWRHAEAEAGEPDTGRRLTPKGEKQARRVAEWLHNRLPDSAKICSSPAKRALQTAHALAEIAHRKLKIIEELSAEASVEDVLRVINRCGSHKGTLVIVGHQPAFGRVARRLLDSDDSDWAIKKGGLVWISRRPSPTGTVPVLRAVMGPDLV